MMGNFYGMGWGFGFGWIFMLLFWGLVIWAVFALVRSVTGHGCCGGRHNHKEHDRNHPPRESSALNILKDRYAKGEISKEEFEKMKKDLTA